MSVGLTAALLWGSATAVDAAPTKPDDDEIVGWPLTKRQSREFKPEERRTPLPANTEATTRALQAWPNEDGVIPGDSAKTPAKPVLDARSAEIAPLQRFTPTFRPRRFTYEGEEFALTVARAAELDKIALRLRTSDEVIEILAYAAATKSGDAGSAKLSTHEAVKLAFKRGMIVRLYLLDDGVRADQINLRALPAPEEPAETPTERVDIDILKTDN